MKQTNPTLSLRIPGTPDAAPKGYFEKVTPALKTAVLNRDQGVCHFCGFRDTRYQEVLALDGDPRDMENMVTVCIFCGQCFDLDAVAQMRSGILIWLPEFEQVKLHHMARDLFRARLKPGAQAERAKRVLDFLLGSESKPREEARTRLGTDEPQRLAEMMRGGLDADKKIEPEDLEKRLAGIRLFPLDRRIIKEYRLEFNQFPQILAHWRSAKGPFQGEKSFPWLEAIDQALFPESRPPEPAQAEPGGTPSGKEHATLAVKLLRDAAEFFRKLADQNPPIREQMVENAGVFEQTATLLESDPLGSVSNAAESGSPNEKSPDSYAVLAAKLLRDAATFFQRLAEQNEPIRAQMIENGQVYRQLADLVERDPLGQLD